ncbi:alpha-ketoglutarate-dependent dioxygenase AlkB family protein [Pseudoalteromonas rubra]|uniref:Alpha-ketoglutarate-dependent dioxygenase AlkB n=1 Tax=Pseudoalteromonas rubra TaxID=43658 RepID=A0A5S3X2L2_9GAMM|nr:alpha-ketoglutarate-dependent dioxygenase AlkB [Pseudoalteromonas rubra]TMP38638.1 alpha-ketoglutarate-dependent dioxygenase AlkB [Pseudoalteromonas rubra]
MSRLNKECLPGQTPQLPPGFEFLPTCIGFEKSLSLYEHLATTLSWQQPSITLFGRTSPIPRLQCFIADPSVSYGYSGTQLNNTPWPDVLRAMRSRLKREYGQDFNALLVNWYRDGQDSMGWHSDDEAELGLNPTIFSLSLGATRAFKIRDKQTRETVTLPLSTGSGLLMTGRSQHDYQHALPKQAGVTQGRINLTFRTVG